FVLLTASTAPGPVPCCPTRRSSDLGAVVDDGDGLSGLVLLDLPDFDSVERGYAAEVERLLRMVDVVVWVVDPQKYADHVLHERQDRKSTRLNSSHVKISYAVFCLKK